MKWFLVICLILLLVGLRFWWSEYGQDSLSVTRSAEDMPVKDTSLQAWGANNSGQLALMAKTATDLQRSPMPVNFDKKIKKLALGFYHTLALTENGELWAWGANGEGQLGIGSREAFVAEPRRVLSGIEIKDIDASLNYSLAVASDGRVWAWGSNYNGQLGDGTFEKRTVPAEVIGVSNVLQVAAGYRFAVALKDDGTLWAWGGSCALEELESLEIVLKELGGAIEQLGGYHDAYMSDFSERFLISDCHNLDVVAINSLTPKQMEGFPPLKAVDAGYGHILGMDGDGQVWTRGCNTYGQSGRRKDVRATLGTVEKMSALPVITAIAAGFRESMALAEDGTVWTWGYEQTKEIIGEHLSASESAVFTRIAPRKVEGLDKIAAIAAGHDTLWTLDGEGHLWAWGDNRYRIINQESVLVFVPTLVSDVLWSNVFVGGSFVMGRAKV